MATNVVPTFFTLVSSLSQLLQAPVGKRPTKQPGKDQVAVHSGPPQNAEPMRVGHVPDQEEGKPQTKLTPSAHQPALLPLFFWTWGTGG